MKNIITQQRLKEVLHYNPDTGIFIWIKPTGKGIHIGDVAGAIKVTRPNNKGRQYIHIGIDGKVYLAHRLAFLYMNGKFPTEVTDHKDCNGLNNKWNNLREATHSQNNGNIRTHTDNKSGIKGVIFHKGKWRATIAREKNKTKHLGTFSTKELARNAYVKAAKQYFGKFARNK